MDIEPLPKGIYNKALALGVSTITLGFSGGNDEGYVDVNFDSGGSSALASEIEDWVWEEYSYSGAGDGNDYGDTIVYNLKTMTGTTSEWTMQRHDEEEETMPFELVDDGSADAEGEDDAPMPKAAAAKLEELKSMLSRPGGYLATDALNLVDELKDLVSTK